MTQDHQAGQETGVGGDFNTAMVQIYERAKNETGFVATGFIKMVVEHGGVETARRLIGSDGGLLGT